MAKVFNVEQLRLNTHLLTGNSGGELFYAGTKLANGDTAVPLTRTLTFSNGIRFSDGGSYYNSLNLSENRNLELLVDDSAIGFNSVTHPQLTIKNDGVTFNMLKASVAGAGLVGGYGNGGALSVVGGSGIEVTDGAGEGVHIKPLGVLNSMLSGQITDDKLNTITTVGKVKGGAVTLEDSTLETGANAGLRIAAQGVNVDHLHSNVAGQGLAGGNGYSIDVGVISGLAVNSSQVGIAPLGVTNSHLYGEIQDSKLNQITTSEKVAGTAVKLYGTTLTGDSNGLYVSAGADGGITKTQLNADVAGLGIGGGEGAALYAIEGSGIDVNSNGINIAKTGILNSMLVNNDAGNADHGITEGKLAGNIPASKLALTYGDGVKITTNDVAVDLHGTRPGLDIDGGKLKVDHTVVRGDSSANQVLSGTYQFKEDVVMLSGLQVLGNLEIQGDTTVTQSNEVQIGDNIIVLNAGYGGDHAPDGGIEIERGAVNDNASIIFDDFTPYGDGGDKWMAGIGSNLYRIETKEFSRSYSAEVVSGVCYHHLAFGHTFESIPNVTVSLQHTGKYSVSNPELLGCMITGIFTTGVHVAFSNNLPHSGYYLNAHATVS